MTNRPQAPELSILLQLFTNRSYAAVRSVSGRVLSQAELGAIREQAAAVLRSAYLRGKIDKQNMMAAHYAPWDEDNDPTDPYIPRKPT